MKSIRSPMAAVDPKPQRKAHFRKPLQPKNFNCSNTSPTQVKHKPTKIFPPLPLPPLLSIEDEKAADKENRPIIVGGGGGWFDASLAEELVTIRRKMERLREERQRTERVLREKDLRLEKAITEMEMRWTEQRTVQKEMDRIRRLKDLEDSCTRIPPFTSLRENEREKKMKEAQFQQQQVETENDKTGD